jgi:ssDNA thymidine ADP-ribosyltransferase, DarT
MPQPLAYPKIYHIVHVDRLTSIIADGCLWSDALIAQRQGTGTTIGMSSIKARRLALPVPCHQGTLVGEYVPFYFCSRSIMLYVIHCANHVELAYRGGQEPIVHLEVDLYRMVAWANANGRRWAFSLSNAGAFYAQFRSQVGHLSEVNWAAVAATDFRSADVKEGKQAEFLVHEFCPWEFVERIGVISQGMAQQVANAMHGAAHRPRVEIRRDWYY